MAHTHAGNAADFLKHVVLADVLEGLARRFKCVRYLDPFAGEGLYRSPPTAWSPPRGHPKEARFREVQPAHPAVYLGSPLVALRALAQGTRVRVTLSDADAGTAAALSENVLRPERWPTVEGAPPRPAVPALTSVKCGPFEPTAIESAEVGEATAVLLDPTYPEGYPALLAQTLQRLQCGLGPSLVMAWGLENWRLGEVFALVGVPAVRAAFSAGFASEVWLAALGPGAHAVESLARQAVAGW